MSTAMGRPPRGPAELSIHPSPLDYPVFGRADLESGRAAKEEP